MSKGTAATKPKPIFSLMENATKDRLVVHLENLRLNARRYWREGQDCVRDADLSIQERRVLSLMVPYAFAQAAKSDLELMQSFLRDGFWKDTEGHSPKAEKILQRSFEFHFKCTKRRGALYKRCCTYTRAFQTFFDEGLDVSGLPAIIKAAHGIEALYAEAVAKNPRADKLARVVREDKSASSFEDDEGEDEEDDGDEDDEKLPSTDAPHRNERSNRTDKLAPRTCTKAASHPGNDTIIKQRKPSMTKVDDSDVMIVEKAAEGISELLANQDKHVVTIRASIEANVNGGWVRLRFINASFD